MGVSDPHDAARRLRESHGLGAISGGGHPGGTGNWLVPLDPPQYLELLYVADRNAADAELLAMDLSVHPLLGWALRTDDIEGVGRRLELVPRPGSVTGPDGSLLASWRTVADEDGSNGDLPFFIQYDDPDNRRPAWWAAKRREAGHDVEVGGFAWVEVGAEEATMRRWIGDMDDCVRCITGAVGLRRLAISTAAGDVILGSPSDPPNDATARPHR